MTELDYSFDTWNKQTLKGWYVFEKIETKGIYVYFINDESGKFVKGWDFIPEENHSTLLMKHFKDNKDNIIILDTRTTDIKEIRPVIEAQKMNLL